MKVRTDDNYITNLFLSLDEAQLGGSWGQSLRGLDAMISRVGKNLSWLRHDTFNLDASGFSTSGSTTSIAPPMTRYKEFRVKWSCQSRIWSFKFIGHQRQRSFPLLLWWPNRTTCMIPPWPWPLLRQRFLAVAFFSIQPAWSGTRRRYAPFSSVLWPVCQIAVQSSV